MGTQLKILRETLLVCLLLFCTQVYAGVTGKISGSVIDSKTGNPIEGATVKVVSTDHTTMTDEDGEYFIINVPGGKYDLTVTYVGFESIVKKDVRVLLDLTTPVDFELAQMAVELKEQMVVYATTPKVQKDLTASRSIYTADKLRNMPNITTVQSILTKYPGVVVDENNDMHVRGGRSGQVSFYYDGYSVQDPFVSNVGMRIIPSALEELSLTTGGFSAEYGEALSGVVNAVTPEGGSFYHGRIRAYEGATHPYDVNTGSWGDIDLHGNRSLNGSFSGPLPGLDPQKYTFFAAGEYLKNNNALPHNWSTSYTATSKFALQPVRNLKVTANLSYYTADGEVYTHRDVNGRSYDFNLDGLPIFEKKAYLGGFSGNYALNSSTVLSASFSRFWTRSKQAPKHLFDLYWRDWPGYSEDSNGVYNGTIDDDNYLNDIDYTDPYEAIGFTTGDDYDPRYQFRQSAYNSFTGSILNQASKRHQFKSGFEYRRYAINWDQKQFYNTQPYGEKYHSAPTFASVYAQDKIEYDYFVINLGLRYDYRDADVVYNTTPDLLTSEFKQAEAKHRVSPRLGVSFPISVNSQMHFNYGIYYQEPLYQYMYMNLQGNLNSGLPLLGNPSLDPEKTISYELGLDHMVSDKIRLDATAYYKNISDLVTTRATIKSAGSVVTRFVNGDYGSVTGFDLAIDRLANGDFFSASIAYSYMQARGNGSYSLEPYYTFLTSNTDTLPPVSEYPLDFDQRHTLTAMLDYRVPANWNGSFFGLPLPSAWGLNVIGYFGSGLPYTKTDSKGNRLGDRNEGRLPASYSIDARFNKDFTVGGAGRLLTFFLEVDNLFNRRNVVDVYSRTGRPDFDQQRIGGGLSLSENDLSRLDRLYDHDPQNYSSPRTIRTGFEMSF